MDPYKQDLWFILTFGRVEGDEEEEDGEEISSFSVTDASAAALADTEREKLLLLGILGKGRDFPLREISTPLSVNTGKVATEHAMEAGGEARFRVKGMKKKEP